MSDEDGNLDDFMMSEDEEMGMIEMEEESSDGEENCEKENDLDDHEIEISTQQNRNDPLDLNWQLEKAKYLEDEQDFQSARQIYWNLYQSQSNDEHSMESRFKAIVNVLRTWSKDVHYSSISEEVHKGIIHDFKEFTEYLEKCQSHIDSSLFQEDVLLLLEELFPSLNRDFLFAIEPTDQMALSLRMKLQMECLELFERKNNDVILSSACVKFKKLTAKIWYHRLVDDKVEQDDIDELQRLCDANNGESRIDIICLILQCYIYSFIKSPAMDLEKATTKYTQQLELITSNSISASQRLGLMIQLHLSKAITILMACNATENVLESPKFYDRVQELRTEFWACLQHIEEIGGSKQNFTFAYEEFILTGFTFSSMILYSADDNKINPFDFEQMKMARNVPIVQGLHIIYQNFIDVNLHQLYDSIQFLGHTKDKFEGLIEVIYHLGQLTKLWTKIAPVYSCIALRDVQDLLQLNESRCLSRDDLLTILMKSIMNDEAEVFYKLDLTKDLVYFGEENKVQLCMYPKESFRLNKGGTNDLEFANNVGIFDTPKQLKNLTLSDFFETLQSSRDNVQSVSHEPQPTAIATDASKSTSARQQMAFQPTHMRYSNKYNELSELIQSKLNM